MNRHPISPGLFPHPTVTLDLAKHPQVFRAVLEAVARLLGSAGQEHQFQDLCRAAYAADHDDNQRTRQRAADYVELTLGALLAQIDDPELTLTLADAAALLAVLSPPVDQVWNDLRARVTRREGRPA